MVFLPGRSTLARRAGTALAVLHLVVVLLPALVEARSERAPGPAQIEAHHSSYCARVHQSATCVSCQSAAVRARVPARIRLALSSLTTRGPETRDGFAPSPAASARDTQSRAPPRSVA